MIQSRKRRNLVIKLLVIFGFWTVVILLVSSITILTSLQEGSSVDVSRILIFELICISPWIVLTPAIVWLVRNYKFEKNKIYISTGVHLAAMMMVFSLHSVVQSYTVSHFYEIAFSWQYIQGDFLGFMDMRVMLYAGILLGVYTLDFQKKNREIRLEEPRLKAELNKAKFHVLLNQIQPGFLLKSIDAIKESLDRSEEESEELLTQFSDLLRIMLANVKKDEVILQEDLITFQLYTNILQKRLRQNIQIEKNIDEECYEAKVPSFLILIPMFEQIMDAVNPGEDAIKRISYNAQLESEKMHLGLFIDGKNIPHKEVSKFLRNTEILKIVEKYRSKYGEVDFKINTGENHIRMKLIFPYLPTEETDSVNEVKSADTILSDPYL